MHLLVILHIWRCELSLWRWFIHSEITLNCVEPRKGPCVKLFTKIHQFDQNIVYKTNLKYRWEKIPENRGKKMSIFCAGQFQFDAIYRYSMILDFVSWSAYWQLTSLFTSSIGQLWNLARLNDVRSISMLSTKIGEWRKQLMTRYNVLALC